MNIHKRSCSVVSVMKLVTVSRGLSRLFHREGVISVVSGGGRVKGEDLNISAILMYIVSMISSI